MKKQVGLVLYEYISPDGGDGPVYRVGQMRNTIQWSIGQQLSRKDVAEILKRTGDREVEVIIKGIDE